MSDRNNSSRIRQGGISSLAVFVTYICILTQPTHAFQDFSSLQTPLERSGRLNISLNTRPIHKSATSSGERLFQKPFYQRDYRNAWILANDNLSIRQKIAERIGNQGTARFASEQGWTKIMGSRNRGIAQGPDSAYWNSRQNRMIALERKGGSSRLKWTFSSLQGSNTNMIRSAKNALQKSNALNPAERLTNARLIDAAAKGKLSSGAVSTPHVYGSPKAPRLLAILDSTNVTREAKALRADLIQGRPELRAVFRKAEVENIKASGVSRHGGKLASLGLLGSGLLTWNAYHQWGETRTSLQSSASELEKSLQLGIAVGRSTQAGILATSSSAYFTNPAGKLPGYSRFGRYAGKAFLPVSVATEGLVVGLAINDFQQGKISRRDLYRRTAGPVVFATLTGSGALIGGIVGGTAAGSVTGGTGAPIGWMGGATIGAEIGAVASIPVTFVADYLIKWRFEDFDKEQLVEVEKAIRSHYGLAPQD